MLGLTHLCSCCQRLLIHLCSTLCQVGRILQRDRDRCKAMVQLDRYEEKVFTLDYDSICHYLGEGDH